MKQTLSCVAAVAVLLVAAHAVAQNAAPTPLRLKEGHSLVLDIAQLERVAVGDPAIVDVETIDQGQLLVVGEKEGKTELRVWTKQNAQRVWAVTVVAASAPDTDLSPGAAKTVDLKVGASVTLSQKDLARVAVSDPEVADIEVSQTGLSIKAVKAGSMTLILWHEGGKREVSEIRVTP
jgi:Flp pilus assembly secretin CpaC